MILYSVSKAVLLKKIGWMVNLSSNLNKTYGSINKPTSHFGQNTKFIDPKTEVLQQKTSFQDKESTKTVEPTTEPRYFEDFEGSRESKFKQKQNKEVAFFFNLDEQGKLNTIEEFRQKVMIKELSIICREMYFYHEKSQPVWKAIEQSFISFIQPPFDQEKIRSLSKFLDGLGKSKRITKNYEIPMSELLPHSSIQSFTQIVVILSRLGTMSGEFLQNIQKIYWRRKQQFGALEINLINYVFAKNGKSIDTSLIDKVDSFPLRGIVLMLKTYNQAGLITPGVLKKCVQPILSRKGQTSFFDLKHLVNVYFKYQYFDSIHLLLYFDEQYRILSRNINEQTLEDIWQYFPDAVNKNKLPPTFVQEVINSLKTLKKRNKLSERAWKKISMTFSKFVNQQIRDDLEKLASR